MQLKHLIYLASGLVLVLGIWLVPKACESDQARIERMLRELAEAANRRDVRGIVRHVHVAYQGPWAGDRRAVQGYVFFATQRFAVIQAQYGDVEIEIAPDNKTAQVTLWCVVWASRAKDDQARVISPWQKTDRVRLTLVKDGWSWLIRKAEINRADRP
ncbi:MAG: hypothetical protein KC609_15870 [Myxococcales bacterium]|nr:hypothetical protein [Myxococcales bacterium]